MGDSPSLRDVESEKIGQLLACFFCDIVSPGAERHEEVSCFVKCHIAVHHGTEADGSDAGQGDVVFFFDISCHFGIGILQARPDVLEGVGPHAVVVAVFPLVISGCDRGVVCADQDGFDSG